MTALTKKKLMELIEDYGNACFSVAYHSTTLASFDMSLVVKMKVRSKELKAQIKELLEKETRQG